MNPFKKFKKDFKGKKVVIMGLGLQGRGVWDAYFFAKIGAKVLVTDLKSKEELAPSLKKLDPFKNKIKLVLGRHRKKDLLSADLVLRNAAVPLASPFLQAVKNKGIRIEMDEALFLQYAEIKSIGITGTRGKSTTTTLIYNILKTTGKSVFLGGNILGLATLPLLEQIKKDDFLVLELSSWQLQGFDWAKISPQISVITSIFEDHLNRYKSMKDYIEDKKTIFKYQTKKDALFLNKNFTELKNMAVQAKSRVFYFSKADVPENIKLKLKGEHNKFNAAAALKVADFLNIPKQASYKVLQEFSGLNYRLEQRLEHKGVLYINDSAITTPAAGIAALKSFTQPIVLIAGGSSKQLNMKPFAKAIVKICKKAVFLKGGETENLISLVKKYGGARKIAGEFSNFKKAVLEAKSLANPDEIVLLSPGCASFGMFKNEYDRGDQFNRILDSFKKED